MPDDEDEDDEDDEDDEPVVVAAGFAVDPFVPDPFALPDPPLVDEAESVPLVEEDSDLAGAEAAVAEPSESLARESLR